MKHAHEPMTIALTRARKRTHAPTLNSPPIPTGRKRARILFVKYGVVNCALGWAGWKTYVGRPETDKFRMAKCLTEDTNLTESDVKEALAILEDVDRRMRRVLGNSHPAAKETSATLELSRRHFAKFQTK